jgi:hypothetical protein
MCPRYMNVPFPAPCHVAAAGVRKQSVWGLRITSTSASGRAFHFFEYSRRACCSSRCSR